MMNNWISYRTYALLGAVPVVGLWFWLANYGGLQVLLPSAVLALLAVFGIVGLFRAGGARRLQAAADAYAELEMARDRLFQQEQKLEKKIHSRRKYHARPQSQAR
jgi:hypothetical protein